MPRKPRMYLAGVPVHVVQRGNNRDACFFSEGDYLAYKGWLGDACQRYGVAVHAYVLMTNHVHLLMTPADTRGISSVMQSLGRRYVQYINSTYQRSGTLWESRHKASLVDAEQYLLSCYRYIEMNPVRAGMVAHPSEYRWSSYHCNANGEPEKLVTPHERLLALGEGESRQRHYQALFNTDLEPDQLHAIRRSASFSMPLGNQRFKEQIERALGRKIGYSVRGRPASKDRAGH